MLQIYIVDVYCSTNTYAGILLESLGARKADAPSLQYRMFAAFVASASDAFATAIPHLLHPTDTDTMSLSSRRRALAAGQVDSSDYPIATESGTASDQHGFNTTVATSGPAFHSVVNAINRLVQRVLGAGDAVDSEQPLMEAGLDSLSKCAFCIFRQIAATGNA